MTDEVWRWQPVDGQAVVWLTEWRTYGFLVHEGTYTATVILTNPNTGERIIEQVENDEYHYWGDYAIDHDED